MRFPFFYSQTKSIWVEKFRGEQLLSRRRGWIRFFQPQLLSFAKDLAWLLGWGWVHVRGADFVLVTNNLLGAAALILRKLGIIKHFTYLIVDYSPVRFDNPWVEKLYVFLDREVARRADSVWTMALPMLEGRERDGRFKLTDLNYRIAPMGNYADQLLAGGEPAYVPTDLVYLGNPRAQNVRADLLLDVAKILVARGNQFRLIYVGPGDTSALKARVAELGLTNLVVFHGSIAEPLELERFLAKCGIGLAPYDPNLPGNFSKFADPAKIKTYLGCGLPVITTDVPEFAREVAVQGAGQLSAFTADAFADHIANYWSNPHLYREARKQALGMGREFSWPRIFDRLMREEGTL